MTYFFAFCWCLALASLSITRVSHVSVFLLSCLVYSSPNFWTSSNGTPELVWSLVLLVTIVAQLIAQKSARPETQLYIVLGGRARLISLIFSVVSVLLLVAVVLRSGGVGVFFQGKYGATPGGSIYLYYTWNSVLIASAASALASRPFAHPFHLIALAQLALIYVSGDRTLPAIYLMMLILRYFHGWRPRDVVRGRRGLIAVGLILVAPIVLVSKSLYTLLPEYGLSWELAMAMRAEYFALVAKDFEPSHSHLILVGVTERDVPYEIGDLLFGLLAILPGSSMLGVNPHLFSETVKTYFFSSWGDAAGVGANFWAQAWVVGGLAGVALFALAINAVLMLIGRFADSRSSWFGLCLLMSALFGFYVHRNSVEQILSFAGRYLAVYVLITIAGVVIWSVSPKKRSRNA